MERESISFTDCDCHGPVNKQNGAASPRTSHPQRGRHSLDSSCIGYKLARPKADKDQKQ